MKTIAGLFIAAVNLLYSSIFGGPIDGTAWDVTVRREGLFHWSSTKETIVFSHGRAVIAGEIAHGLDAALYEATEAAGATAFEIKLDGDEPVLWTGRINGQRIQGVVRRGRGAGAKRFVFAGERKPG